MAQSRRYVSMNPNDVALEDNEYVFRRNLLVAQTL